MRKLIKYIVFCFLLSALSFQLSAQGIVQNFGAYSITMDSLNTHTGLQNQYLIVYGAHALNDGYGGVFIYDSLSTATEIPFKVIKPTGITTGRWIAVQIAGAGSGDSSIYNNPDFVVINILTIPPSSPSTGDKYLAGIGSAGAWSGQDNDIETWSGSAWTPTVPTKGQLLINGFNDDVLKFDGTNWNVITTTYIFHNKGDNYGPINLTIGNKKNKYFHFLTNNIDRGGFSNAGYFSLYSVRDYVSGDSVLTIHNGEVRRAPASAFSGSGSTNLNIGSAYRWAVPGTNNIKTFRAGLGFILDSSSHTNELTGKVDTAYLNTLYSNAVLRITNSDFSTSVNYVNTSFTGKVPTVYYNNIQRNLYFGTEYDTLSGGGIKLLLWTVASGDYYYISGSNIVANIGGGGGSVAPVQQNYTSGSAVTVTNGVNVLNVNPSSTLSSSTITLPATANTDGTIEIYFGGTLTTGTVVTSLTISPNTGQTIIQAAAPTSASAGESISYRLIGTTWRARF
jgi:hypothetical protein